MRILLQRVSEAKVTVESQAVGSIRGGLLLLVGVGHGDTLAIGQRMIDKALDLRIFEDAAGKMNLSLRDLTVEQPNEIGVLLVSQFTLYADTRKGRRPSFIDAADPETALALIDALVAYVAGQGITCETGQFGSHMQVSLTNDGPVTIWLDSENLAPK
jgi:D-tyrosyl-tRNA(Tyr) deacylase